MMILALSPFLILWVTMIVAANARHLRSSTTTSASAPPLQPDFQTVTTIECGQLHDEPYKGRLTLQYKYRVDTFSGVLLDVPAIEDALVQAVAAWLNTCDHKDRPHFAVELTDSHEVSFKGKYHNAEMDGNIATHSRD